MRLGVMAAAAALAHVLGDFDGCLYVAVGVVGVEVADGALGYYYAC